MILLEAVLALFMIVICAELFINGVEVFGENLSLSQAVVGSILAAIGTALPETIIPMVAIFLYKGETGAHIGVGAILGAPFMLVTAGLFLIGLGVVITYLQGKRPLQVYLEPHTFIKDFSFFLLSYSLAIFIPLLFPKSSRVNYVLAFILLLNYTVYLYLTFRSKSLEVVAHKDLYLEKAFKWLKIELSKKHTILLALLQTFLAVLTMIKSAHLFVYALEVLSKKLGLSPLLFALLVAPFATELPEKFNSLLWTLRGKDVLALGNMTGAMVFQSTFPVSVGLLFTDWQIKGLALISALMTLSLGFVYIIFLTLFKKLPISLLLLSGLAYFLYILLVLLYS